MVNAADGATVNTAPSKRRDLLLRIPLTIVGGYATASALVSGLAVSLPFNGMARGDAVLAASMLGFPMYLALILWGAAERQLTRLALGYAIAAAVGIAPWALSRAGG